MGKTFVVLGQVEKGMEAHEKCLAIGLELGDKGIEGYAYCDLAIACQNQLLVPHEKAIEYLNKGLAIAEEIGDQRMIGTVNGRLGAVFGCLGQYETGIEC
jgi:hypothetical protein